MNGLFRWIGDELDLVPVSCATTASDLIRQVSALRYTVTPEIVTDAVPPVTAFEFALLSNR